MRILSIVLAAVLLGNSYEPDPALTPGSIRSSGPATGCERSKHPHLSRGRADAIMAKFGLPSGPHPDYEIDHLIPWCLGGSDDSSNLWPQPRSTIEPVWNAERKDKLETLMCRMVCDGQIALPDAQAVFSDWVTGYKVYWEGEKAP